MKTRLITTLLLLAGVANANLFDVGDVSSWTGSGANEAVLIIDWNVSGIQSEAYGYRWDGAATAADMLQAVATAESNLYLRIGSDSGFGIPVFGIGNDLDSDGFSISDSTVFTSGIAVTGDPANPEATSVDADDVYQEGWWTGFWGQYASTNGSPFGGSGVWEEGFGVSSHNLGDGDWSGLSFAPSFSQTTPTSPTAVPEPFTGVLFILGLAGVYQVRKVLLNQG